ncbi:MAG: nucleotidyltransferase domain-containing protein [Desulfobacterales bacterium]|nr:nucleotidyltransferase domain-containing protein [Desulfobacterales bacterium]
MDKRDILTAISEFHNQTKDTYRIKKIGIFGSYARNTINRESDVDIVVVLDDQDLFNLIGIKQDLEDRLKRHVDVVSYRNRMNPYLRKKIDNEAVYV